MKNQITLIAILLSPVCLGQSEVPLQGWKFITGDLASYARPECDDSSWENVQPGRAWESQGHANYDGYGWYRVKFVLPPDLKNDPFSDQVQLFLGKIDDSDQVYLNGRLVGANAVLTERPVMADMTQWGGAHDAERKYALSAADPRLKWGGENTLAVRVYDSGGNGGMLTSPLCVRMKPLADCLVFDMNAPIIQRDDGQSTQTITIQNLSKRASLQGQLALTISAADTAAVVSQKTEKVALARDAQPFSAAIPAASPQRLRLTCEFTEADSGRKVSRSRILPMVRETAEEHRLGDYYDYSKTGAPERPYLIDYPKTMTMKMYLAQPDGKGGSTVFMTFAQALENLKIVDKLTRGMPKIAYLVGWQYLGHDDKYPAWHEVNAALKRPEDATPLDSYLWLAHEASKCHTIISVHINMTDAYPNSPLWQQYTNADLFARNADGSRWRIGGTEEYPVYQVCYEREWASGMAQKRIDYIIDMLKLRDARTVHLDAFFPRFSEYHGITQDMETRAMRKIYRYWRDKGVDVTSEQQARMRPDPFIGLQPMAWWFDLTLEQQAAIPASLACGGLPYTPNTETGGFLFGQQMHGEDLFGTYGVTPFVPSFQKQFCTTSLPSYYQNLRKLERYDAANQATHYSGGLALCARDMTMKENGRLLREHNDVFIPVGWAKLPEIIAFSETGYAARPWELPPDWAAVKTVSVSTVTEQGLVLKDRRLPVVHGKITLSLNPMEEALVCPSPEN